MKAAVLPNLDKRGAYDVVLKLGEILKNEERGIFARGNDFCRF